MLPDNAPLVTALDDTALRKTGRKIPGVGYRRDPMSPPFHVNLVPAQRFVQLSASADRQPILAVASCAYLLLAALRVYGINEQGPAMPVPKWQKPNATGRVSRQKLLQKLRSEIWAYALDQLEGDCDDFMIDPAKNTKSQESEFPLELAAIFARAG